MKSEQEKWYITQEVMFASVFTHSKVEGVLFLIYLCGLFHKYDKAIKALLHI